MVSSAPMSADRGTIEMRRSIKTQPSSGVPMRQVWWIDRAVEPFLRLLLILLAVGYGCSREGQAQEKVRMEGSVRIIYDTDMGNDIDDALALGVIHALQSREECTLLAVTVSKDNFYAAAFSDLVNHFYGRPEIPVGLGAGWNDPGSWRWCMNRNWPATNPTHRSITYQERTTMACRARPSG